MTSIAVRRLHHHRALAPVWPLAAALWLSLAALYLLLTTTQPVNTHDEGVVAYTALRVLDGDVPYRDYWTFYAPGQTYALAALFRLFGASLGTLRIYDALIRLALVVVVFGLAKRVAPPSVALIPAVLLTLWLGEPFVTGGADFPALLFTLCSVSSLLSYLTHRRPSSLFASGAFTGLCAIFRHDFGVYTFLMVGLALTLSTVLVAAPLRFPFGRSVLALAAALTRVVIGVSAVVLPVLWYLVLNGVDLFSVWSDLFLFPIRDLQRLRALPLPPLSPLAILNMPVASERSPVFGRLTILLDSWLPFYLPPLLFVAVAMWCLVALFRRTKEHVTAVYLLSLVSLGLLFFLRASSRADRIHQLPMAVVAVLVASAVLPRMAGRLPPSASLIGCLALPLLLGYTYVARPLENWLRTVDASLVPSVASCGTDCAFIDQEQREAVQYVQRLTTSDERIFVGKIRHDQIHVNDVLFYFLVERHSASKYHVLHPGVATTLAVQTEIIGELQERGVRHVVLWSAGDLPGEANESSVSSGVTVLDDYLRSAYRRTAEFGAYSVWQRL
ncbi:MAG: glycosyltransferase family 39 protein [Chloroflexota bacterium]|nr:glycosyltransferase family 39 protein [Chloroflexota bacterium]